MPEPYKQGLFENNLSSIDFVKDLMVHQKLYTLKLE